jgi:hypothetical protein
VRRTPILLLAAAALLAACSSSNGASGSTSSTTAPTPPSSAVAADGIVPGYGTTVDQASPLIISAVGPAPIPVTGTDAKVHLVYELEVLNFSPRAATLTGLATMAGGPEGEVVASIEGDELTERTILVVDTAPTPIAELPAGRTALILVDDVYDTKADVPSTFSHRLTATFGPVPDGYAGVAAIFPEGPVTQFGGPMAVGAGAPVVIGPPLAGDDWLAGSGCCSLSTHRGTMAPVGGRINASERYAVDWIRVDRSADAELTPGLVVASHRGDPTSNESYLAYGEPLLAVADGTVVEVISDVADTAPMEPPVGLGLAQLGGNIVTIDIGGGVFAFYAHLVPGSPTVAVGDTVRRGQVIGTLGNSGNSTGAHLHFQLATAPASLTGDNVPFEIDTLTLVGNYPGGVFAVGPDAGARTDQLPLMASLVSFPPVP